MNRAADLTSEEIDLAIRALRAVAYEEEAFYPSEAETIAIRAALLKLEDAYRRKETL